MNQYHIRFNKSRGQPGRGSQDHVWRVFENNQEYLFKHFRIEGVSVVHDATTGAGTLGDDYNIYCQGYMSIDRETSTAIITGSPNQTTA
jgi:hypothetical protein